MFQEKINILSKAIASVVFSMAIGTFTCAAQASPKNIDIEQQPLSSALAELGKQSGVQIVYEASLVVGLKSSAVQGNMEIDEALKALLAGTGLQYSQSDNTIMLFSSGSSAALELGATSITGVGVSNKVTEGTNSYSVSEVSMAKGQKLKEIPQSVSVVTKDRIEDQALESLDDVLRQMPGVAVSGDLYDGGSGRYYSRGSAITNVQTDGVSTGHLAGYQNGGNASFFDLAMYDHVEVLRGADGLYGGAGDSSGTINMVRKRPLKENQVKIASSIGSWDNYRLESDISGPVALDGAMRARFVAAYQDKKSFRDYYEGKKDFIFWVGELDLGEKAIFSLGGAYESLDGTPEGSGVQTYYNGDSLGVSRHTNWITPWSRKNERKTTAFMKLDYDFSEDWNYSSDFNWVNYKSDTSIGRLVGGSVNPANDLNTFYSAYDQSLEVDSYAFDSNLSGGGDVWGLTYSLLFGLDYSLSDLSFEDSSAIRSFGGVSIWDIDMGQFAKPDYTYSSETFQKIKEAAAYARVKLDVRDDLHVVIGGRYTDYENESGDWKDSGVITPFGGVIYDIDSYWVTYVSVSKIYKPQANLTKGPVEDVSPLMPLEGRNYEVGVKGDFYDGRLTTSFSLYRLERNGEAVSDSSYDGVFIPSGVGCCYLNKGRVVTKGFELEINGEVASGFKVAASYAYAHSEDKEADGQYNTLNAPRDLLKVWGVYNLPGAWSKVSLGGGVNAQSRTWAKGNHRTYGAWEVEQPGYALWNGLVEYKINSNLDISVNANNIFDKKYYSAIYSNVFGNYYGAPRNYVLTLRGSF